MAAKKNDSPEIFSGEQYKVTLSKRVQWHNRSLLPGRTYEMAGSTVLELGSAVQSVEKIVTD